MLCKVSIISRVSPKMKQAQGEYSFAESQRQQGSQGALWERSPRLHSHPSFCHVSTRLSPRSHYVPRPFFLTGQLGLACPGCFSKASVRRCFRRLQGGEGADLSPGPQFSFPPPSPRTGLLDAQWSSSRPARWRKKDGGKREGLLQTIGGTGGRAPLSHSLSHYGSLGAPANQPPPHSAAARLAAGRVRKALLAPSLRRAALSPWQPRRDYGARRAGRGRGGAGRRRCELKLRLRRRRRPSGGTAVGSGLGVSDLPPPPRKVLRRGLGSSGHRPWPWTPRK